jgi:hypothetical protein
LSSTLRIDYITPSSGNKNGATIYTYIPQQNDPDPKFTGTARKVAVNSSYQAYIPVTANRDTTANRWRAGYIKVFPNNYREMEKNFIGRYDVSAAPGGATQGGDTSAIATAINSEGALIILSDNSNSLTNYYNQPHKEDVLLTSIDPTVTYDEYYLGTDPYYTISLTDFSSSTANEAQHTTDSTKVLYTTSGLSQNAGLTVSTPAQSLYTQTYVTNLDTF